MYTIKVMEHLIRLFKLDKSNKVILIVKLVAYITLVASFALLVTTAFATIDSHNINQGVSITLAVFGSFIFVSALVLLGLFIYQNVEDSKKK